jgi:hypothetical protein
MLHFSFDGSIKQYQALNIPPGIHLLEIMRLSAFKSPLFYIHIYILLALDPMVASVAHTGGQFVGDSTCIIPENLCRLRLMLVLLTTSRMQNCIVPSAIHHLK